MRAGGKIGKNFLLVKIPMYRTSKNSALLIIEHP